MEDQKQGSAEKLFKNFGKKIDELLEKAKTNSEGLDQKFEEGMAEMKRNWDKFDSEVKNFTEEHKDKFQEVGLQIEKAAQELKKAVEAAFSKSKNKS